MSNKTIWIHKETKVLMSQHDYNLLSTEQKSKMIKYEQKFKLHSSAVLAEILLLCAVSLSSCADVQPHIQPCLEGHVYGFWGGFWHGFIAVFAWISSWFSDYIAVYAVNNNGGWYNFGFLLGVGALTGSASRASK